MGHHVYQSAHFEQLLRQHNIMAFVGNGFDIQAMADLGLTESTRYEKFYEYLEAEGFDPNNPLVREMARLKEDGHENWSDVEAAVENLLAANTASSDSLLAALREIQSMFSEFLDRVVPTSLLTNLGTSSANQGLAINSLSNFLKDLDQVEYARVRFPSQVDNLHMYNFLFVNFNYTPLLDDYVYLDQVQFDPLPYKTTDRQFRFNYDPNNYLPRPRFNPPCESYVAVEVVYPHGQQSIPRSLLFGIDEPDGARGDRSPSLRLSKPFWAQTERRFAHYFEDTELFIIFGCSLGKSDRWWWRHIAESIGSKRTRDGGKEDYTPEVVIYAYRPNVDLANLAAVETAKQSVRTAFLEAADQRGRTDLLPYVHVVLHNKTTQHVWLNSATST